MSVPHCSSPNCSLLQCMLQIKLMGTRDRAAEIDFSTISLEEEVESQLKEAAVISMGTEVSEADMLNIVALCDQVSVLLSLLDACCLQFPRVAALLHSPLTGLSCTQECPQHAQSMHFVNLHGRSLPTKNTLYRFSPDFLTLSPRQERVQSCLTLAAGPCHIACWRCPPRHSDPLLPICCRSFRYQTIAHSSQSTCGTG